MADLDARTDSFITMLLDVRGRVRPGDLMGVSDAGLPAVLQGYVDAHPHRNLRFEGDALVAVAENATSVRVAPAPVQVDSSPSAMPDPVIAFEPALAEDLPPPPPVVYTPADVEPVDPSSWYLEEGSGIVVEPDEVPPAAAPPQWDIPAPDESQPQYVVPSPEPGDDGTYEF